MGFFDWVKQTASNVGKWVNEKIIQPGGKAIQWVNQNVVQPGANALKDLPVVGGIAKTVGQVGNAAQNLSEMATGKRKLNLGEAMGTVKEVYNTVKKRG